MKRQRCQLTSGHSGDHLYRSTLMRPAPDQCQDSEGSCLDCGQDSCVCLPDAAYDPQDFADLGGIGAE